ncbi:MAG: hypothetical protein IT285_11705 [Bdellovibrionales bacterium]|nr:hypothetical protein [Bdellovibrionales bacterium]
MIKLILAFSLVALIATFETLNDFRRYDAPPQEALVPVVAWAAVATLVWVWRRNR